jgi:hypothetical protein
MEHPTALQRLSRSVLAVTEVLGSDLSRQRVDGSQAWNETRTEPLAGLSRRPGSDAILHAQLLRVAAVDHVRAMAHLIVTGSAS